MTKGILDPRYRHGIGVMLINDKKKVFVGLRIDTPDAWQMPQGGMDEGENPKTTALRELKEEIGTNQVRIIAETPNWLKYDLPHALIPEFWDGKYLGQQQRWFLMQLDGDDSLININTQHPEFSEWKWVDVQTLPDLIISFKRSLYEELIKIFFPIIEKL